MEELLEGYFMLIDQTWNKLRTLNEYIDDTEDLIRIELDSVRNQQNVLTLIVAVAALSVAIMNAVAGLFGMNVLNPWNEQVIGPDRSLRTFAVSCCCSMTCRLAAGSQVGAKDLHPTCVRAGYLSMEPVHCGHVFRRRDALRIEQEAADSLVVMSV